MDYRQKYLKYKQKYLDLKAGARTRSNKSREETEYLKQYKMSIPSQLKNSTAEITIDVIGSYILEMTTRLMDNIITHFNTKFHNNVKIYRGFNSNGHLIDLMSNKYNVLPAEFYNTLIPFGDPDKSTHWVYYDNEGKIHNSYTYHKQVYAGDQFCQTHALIMAFFPEKRSISTHKSAYDDLLHFWAEQLFPYFNSIQSHDFYMHDHIQAIDAIVKANSDETWENKILVEQTIKALNELSRRFPAHEQMSVLFIEIYKVMASDEAKDYVSEWGISE